MDKGRPPTLSPRELESSSFDTCAECAIQQQESIIFLKNIRILLRKKEAIIDIGALSTSRLIIRDKQNNIIFYTTESDLVKAATEGIEEYFKAEPLPPDILHSLEKAEDMVYGEYEALTQALSEEEDYENYEEEDEF